MQYATPIGIIRLTLTIQIADFWQKWALLFIQGKLHRAV
jgi:hypothetical protein